MAETIAGVGRPKTPGRPRSEPALGGSVTRLRTTQALARSIYPVAALIFLVIVWELAVRLFAVPTLILPAPSAVVRDLVAKRSLYFAFSIPTLVEVLSGFAVAAVAGIILGILVSFSEIARRALYPLLVSSQMVPKVAIAPVLIIWFGTGLQLDSRGQ